jgi:uncharacterized protein (TIGR02145 family)
MNIRNLHFTWTIVALFSFVSIGCDEELPSPPKGAESVFTDARDNKSYKTVEIGSQIWMAENLAFSIDSGIASWNRNTSFGYLYNWETAVKAAPEGLHLPTKEEWEELIEYLGGSDVAGGRMKENGTTWEHPNTDGTNSSGFTARPAGYKNIANSAGVELFLGEGRWGYWWSSTLDSSSYAWAVRLHNSDGNAIVNDYNPKMAFSVRCIKD